MAITLNLKTLLTRLLNILYVSWMKGSSCQSAFQRLIINLTKPFTLKLSKWALKGPIHDPTKTMKTGVIDQIRVLLDK